MTASAITSSATTVAAATIPSSPVQHFINTRNNSRQPYLALTSTSFEAHHLLSSSPSSSVPTSLSLVSSPLQLLPSSPTLSFLVGATASNNGGTIRPTTHFVTSSPSAVATPHTVNILGLTTKTTNGTLLSTTSGGGISPNQQNETIEMSNATATANSTATVTNSSSTTISLHSSKTTAATILTSSKRPMIIIYPTVSPESIVIPIVSCIFGFPLLALLVICCLRRRAKLARERDRRRNYDMQDHAVSLVRFSPIHRLNNRSSRAISLRPERSLSRGFPSLELDTVIEERSDAEQTQTDLLSPESPLESHKYRDFNSS